MANAPQTLPPLPVRSETEWYEVQLTDGTVVWLTRDELARAPAPGRVLGYVRRV